MLGMCTEYLEAPHSKQYEDATAKYLSSLEKASAEIELLYLPS